MDCVPLDQLERELKGATTSVALEQRFAEWRRSDPILAAFKRPIDALHFLRRRSSPANEDAVMRGLVAWAQTEPAARRLVLYALLPGLKNLARRALVTVDEREELWATLLSCAWEQICAYSIERRPRRVAANLLLDTLRATLAAMRAGRGSDLPTPVQPTSRVVEEGDDVDALLNRAVIAGAISRAEADLVLSTRFDGIPLAHIATASGEPYNRVKVRRQRAERRLLVWLGYPPVPRGNQKRPLSSARVVGAGS